MSAENTTRNGNLIVVAGAGTGKTYSLVETCLKRILEGAGIDEILIVTFTKAAAAELRRRISLALQSAFTAQPESMHLAKQITLLDRAQISTLHSFCLDLVSRHFSELGLSPRLATLEAAQAAILETETLEKLFESYYVENGSAKNLMLQWFGGEDRQVRQIVREMHAFTQTRPDPREWFAEQRALLAQAEPQHWRLWLQEAVEDFANRWRPRIEAQAEGGNPARSIILRLMDQRALAEIGALYTSMDKKIWPLGSKQDYRDPVAKMFGEAEKLSAWTSAATLLEDWNLCREAALGLLRIAEDFSSAFAEAKRQRGLVDFSDLEQFALELLWDHGPTDRAREWQRRFKWIFVDEYQDINSAQDRIIQALARDGAGNRFLVGDVKQSIYGFRQAEPEIFDSHHAKWKRGEGGACSYLTRNWRSHERILDFVNGLFSAIMPGYDETARLQFADVAERAELSARNDPSPKVSMHMIPGESEGDDESVFGDMERDEKEAEVAAELCRHMVEGEPVALPSGRKADFGDIVILMRSAAQEVETFAKVFSRRGIPFEAKRGGFFECIEILDLTNLLTILDNPLQDIPLLGVLRSPLAGFSVADLADLRSASPRGQIWDALQAWQNEKAASFLERYARWRKLGRHHSLAERLEAILDETGYEDWAAAQDRGAQRRANVRRLIQFARQFDEMRGEGLYLFLKFVEDQARSVESVAPPGVESQGAVRLMTVHQSKGLQFPVVIVAGLGKRFNKSDFNDCVLLDDRYGLCLKARPPGKRRQYETIAFHMARQKQEQKLVSEELRILYVALTRAQSRLALIGTSSKKFREPANCMLDWIGPWLGSQQPDWLEKETGIAASWTWRWHRDLKTHAATEPKVEMPNASPAILAEIKTRVEWQYPFLATTRQEAKSSATALRRGLADEPELAHPIAPIKRSQLRGEELGQATHRFLQYASLTSFGDIESMRAEGRRIRDARLMSDKEVSAVDFEKVRAFWTSDFGKELSSNAESIKRELIFTAKFSRADLIAVGAPAPGDIGEEFIVVQGAADLAAVFPDELWLVDFKTDRMPLNLLRGRIEEYCLQLRIYALALSRIYRRPVTRICLHFLEHGCTEWVTF